MATASTYSVAEAVKVHLFPKSMSIRISIGDADIRLSLAEYRSLVEQTNALLEGHAVSRIGDAL